MRVGLAVDSACDLPLSFLKANGVFVLPITVHINGQSYTDNRDPKTTSEYFRSGMLTKENAVRTTAFSSDETRDLFLDRIVTEYDFALVETITQARSQVYANTMDAALRIAGESRERRQQAGAAGPFSMRVVNSRTVFSGQGVLAAATVGMIHDNVPKSELRRRVEAIAAKVYTYVIAPDIYYLRERARQRGDNSVNWLGAFLGNLLGVTPVICAHDDRTWPVAKVRGFEAAVQKLFANAEQQIRRGLQAPYLCVSYAGDEDAIAQLPGFDSLRRTAEAHDVEVLTTMMGIAGGTWMGPGTVSLGIAADANLFTTE
jgi:DegV family protein with EDD domain